MESFEAWRKRLDKMVSDHFGAGLDDFPDWGSRDAFDDGLTVEEAFDVWVQDMEDDGIL